MATTARAKRWRHLEGRRTSIIERALDGSLLARRDLVQRGTCALSTVIRHGVASGAFRPGCASWAIRRLPFAIVAGACAHWVLGLATGPSLRPHGQSRQRSRSCARGNAGAVFRGNTSQP